MALEHALLVALLEQPAAGLELTQRFERSIGHFWQASHQQIYRTLARMAADGWVVAEVVEQTGRPAKRVFSATPAGEAALRDWVSRPAAVEALRSSLAVRMRAASYGDRAALLTTVRTHLDEHRATLAVYERFLARDYPDPTTLTGQALDHYLILRGGLLTEQARIAWLEEYLAAFDPTTPGGSR